MLLKTTGCVNCQQVPSVVLDHHTVVQSIHTVWRNSETPKESFSIKKIFVWPFPKLYTDWDQKLHSCKILHSCKRRRDLVKSWLVMMYSISCFLWPLSEGSVPDGDVAGIRLHTISTWVILTHRIGLAHTPSPFHLRVENHSLFFCWWIITIGLVKL